MLLMRYFIQELLFYAQIYFPTYKFSHRLFQLITLFRLIEYYLNLSLYNYRIYVHCTFIIYNNLLYIRYNSAAMTELARRMLNAGSLTSNCRISQLSEQYVTSSQHLL